MNQSKCLIKNLLFSQFHDKDRRARHLSLDLVEKRGKLIRVPSLADPLTPASLRGLDHHREANLLSHLEITHNTSKFLPTPFFIRNLLIYVTGIKQEPNFGTHKVSIFDILLLPRTTAYLHSMLGIGHTAFLVDTIWHMDYFTFL